MSERDRTNTRTIKDARINLRASARQEQILRRAAAATDHTMTDFILDSAIEHAERVLADRRWFVVDDQQWDEFERLLDAPLPSDAKFKRLLDRPDPFQDQA